MKQFPNLMLAAIAVLACTGCGLIPKQPLPALPTYVCKRAAGKIVVDGKIDEPSWAAAETMQLVLREGTGAPKHATTAKALWNDEYLYVAFQCTDPDIWATLSKHDDPLWREEVVEVFLDPKGDHNPYFEIEVNPLNAVVDLRLMRDLKGLNGQGFMRSTTWDCKGMITATSVKGEVHSWQTTLDPDGQWSVELAIPFAGLDALPNSPPKNGDVWRANFYRIERPAAEAEQDDEYICWSPIVTSPSFHTVERFGYLRFSAEAVGASQR